MHLPLGQASDAPHLPNERIRLLNLTKGVSVIESLLANIAASSGEAT
jgi:hypothetical protein